MKEDKHGANSLQGKEAVAFERFMAFRKSGGNHCHINVIPAPASAASTARAVRSCCESLSLWSCRSMMADVAQRSLLPH